MRKQTWPFPAPLVRGTLVKRYKRFLADVCLEGGQEITAHCPNTGSMKTCWNEGDEVWLSKSDNAKRKLPYTWELTKTQGGYIGVNTARPNQVVEWAIYQKLIPELCQWTELKREVAYGNEKSRIDIRLNLEKSEKEENDRYCFIEIKNTTLYLDRQIQFPDAVTLRGQKHIRELVEQVRLGHRGVMFYFVNRPEGDTFAPADSIDPEYGKLLRQAQENGVEILAYRGQGTPEGYQIGEKMPLKL